MAFILRVKEIQAFIDEVRALPIGRVTLNTSFVLCYVRGGEGVILLRGKSRCVCGVEDLPEPVVVRLLQQAVALVHHEKAKVFKSEAWRHADVIHQAAGRRDEDVDGGSPKL